MNIITLRRELSRDDGTLGMLEIRGKHFPTLELPPGAGDKHDTCLSPGMYRLRQVKRASGEKALAVVAPEHGVWQLPSEVPRHRITDARSAVYLAAGACLDDLIGSHIAPGISRRREGRSWLLDSSVEAMNQIRTLIQSQLGLTLVIE